MTGLEFALAALAGVLLGRVLPDRRKGPKPPKPVQPICGCTHHHSYHDPKTGECNAAVLVPSRYDNYGNVTARKHEPCGCARYSGPVPLPEVYAPEVAS